ncbi:interaptin-like [Haliotis rubra]|uniref:interaptin-like n=1 Tax=Haliotis rubra TaxID=36100 RepID=UPI001EE5F0B0|nr:interaptin-like [Haliotis rubra]
MGGLYSYLFGRQEGRCESRHQTVTVTGVGGEDTEANTVYATGIHNETIINPDTEAALEEKLSTLGNKIQNHQRQLNERDSQIKKLENDITQQQDKAKSKDTENIQDQIGQLHEKVNMHRSEIARLENEVLPDLMAQGDEAKEQLEKHEQNAQGKMEEVAVLNEKMQKLADKLEACGRDVARKRAKVEDLCREIGKLEEDFKKIKSDQKTQRTVVQEMTTEMKTIKAAQAKQTKETQNLPDEMREQRKLNQQMEKQHDEKLRKVKDQLKEEKMAREAAERKIKKQKSVMRAI